MQLHRLARKEVGLLADDRALEIEMNRTNPLSGRGATPSMGLSQVRGGAWIDPHTGAVRTVPYAPGRLGSKAPSAAKAQGEALAEHLHDLHGAGFVDDFIKGLHAVHSVAKHISSIPKYVGMVEKGYRVVHPAEGQSRVGNAYQFADSVGVVDKAKEGIRNAVKHAIFGKGRAVLSDDLSEMEGSGRRHKREHEMVMELYGGSAPKVSKASLQKAVLELPKIVNEPLPEEDNEPAWLRLAKAVFPVFVANTEAVRDIRLPEGAKDWSWIHDLALPIVRAIIGHFEHRHRRAREAAAEAATVEGGSGAYDGQGRRKKQRRVMSAEDPRRKRAAIVRKVMADKGLSMIEASKYVKAHGLY